MADNKVVNASDVIALFKEAFSNDSGYIMGTAGEKWTQAKQDAMNKQPRTPLL